MGGGFAGGFLAGVRCNVVRSIFWLSCSWGSPDVNITHTTLHFTSSVVRALPPAPTYHLCEAWWQSLWWGWGVSGLLLQCSAAWQRKARRRQSPSCVVDTYLYTTERYWTQGQAGSKKKDTPSVPTVDYKATNPPEVIPYYTVNTYFSWLPRTITEWGSNFHISKNTLWPPWESVPGAFKMCRWSERGRSDNMATANDWAFTSSFEKSVSPWLFIKVISSSVIWLWNENGASAFSYNVVNC